MKIKKWAGISLTMMKYLSGRAKKYHDVADPKNRWTMLIDHLRWISREREFNSHYYAQGINGKGEHASDFIGRRSFSRYSRLYADLIRNNSASGALLSRDILIKDKFYCSAILKAAGFSVIENLFLVVNGCFYPLAETKTISALADGDYFLKNTMMESGCGVIGFSMHNGTILISDGRSGIDVIEEITGTGRWIVQKKKLSHAVIRAINETALNTTRIYTIATVKGIEYLGGFQAFATGGSATDSWQYGAVYVSIDPYTNSLGRFGITSLSDLREGVLFQHPDSGVDFSGYQIPFMKDSLALCRKAHSLFDHAFIIGWDVAITDDGPVVVEANENPGINVLQCFGGGIRKRVQETYGELRTKYHG